MALKANSFFALLFVMLLFSCENQSEFPEPTLEDTSLSLLVEDHALIQSTKQAFEQNFNLASSGKSGSTKRQSLKKYPIWHRAQIFESSQVGKIVIVPLYYPEALSISKGEGDEKISLTSLTNLFIYKDEKGKTHTEVVTKIPDTEYWDNPEGGFKGKVLVEKWNGKFITGYKLDDESLERLEAPQPNAKMECETIYYYTCVETPYSVTCSFDYSETICEGGGGGDGSNGGDIDTPITPGDYGGGGDDTVIEGPLDKVCPKSFNYSDTGEGFTANVTDIHDNFAYGYGTRVLVHLQLNISVMCIQVRNRNLFGERIDKADAAEMTANAYELTRTQLVWEVVDGAIRTNQQLRIRFKEILREMVFLEFGGYPTIKFGTCNGVNGGPLVLVTQTLPCPR